MRLSKSERSISKAIPDDRLRIKISARVSPSTKQFIDGLQDQSGIENPGRAIDVLAIMARNAMPEPEKRVAIFARIDPSTKDFLDKVQVRVGANNIGRALDEIAGVVMKENPDSKSIKIIP